MYEREPPCSCCLRTGIMCRKQAECPSVLPFSPKYRLGHPKKYLFLLSKKKIPDQIIQKIFHLILKKEALVVRVRAYVLIPVSASFLAEISVRSPWKLFIFII